MDADAPAAVTPAGSHEGESMLARRIQALAARGASLQGSARAVLDARLQALAQLRQAAPPDRRLPAHARQACALAQLRADLENTRVAGGTSGMPASAARENEGAAAAVADAPVASAGGFPALAALGSFRATWAHLRTTSQLQHALADVPEDAGPMHSTVLVHRALALMHELAPGYLQHFLGHVDALAGLERLSPAPATTPAPRSQRPPPPPSPANASGPGKAPRPRPRGRRRRG